VYVLFVALRVMKDMIGLRIVRNASFATIKDIINMIIVGIVDTVKIVINGIGIFAEVVMIVESVRFVAGYFDKIMTGTDAVVKIAIVSVMNNTIIQLTVKNAQNAIRKAGINIVGTDVDAQNALSLDRMLVMINIIGQMIAKSVQNVVKQENLNMNGLMRKKCV